MTCSYDDKPTPQRLAEEAARLTQARDELEFRGKTLQDRAVNIIVPLRRENDRLRARVTELEALVNQQDAEVEALRQQLKEKR